MTDTARQADTEREWPTDPFAKALAAEPRLHAVDRMVRMVVAMAPTRRSGKPMCSDCFWTNVLKPIVQPLIGWERGDPGEEPPEKPHGVRMLSHAEVMERRRPRPRATTSTERWLRSAEAYDVVTDRWLKALHNADPANGCGLPG